MLRDSARIQREDVRNANLQQRPRRADRAPLRAGRRRVGRRAAPARRPTPSPSRSCPGVTLTYLDAGHILGSAMVQLDLPRRTAGAAGSSSPATSAGATWGCCPTRRSSRTSTSWSRESTYGNRELDPYDTPDQAAARDRRPRDPAPEQDRHPGLQPGPDPADGLLPPGAVRDAQGPADPGLRRQPAGHAPDRDPPRPSRGVHARRRAG